MSPRADGTYLITGGQGGIGLKVAEWLLARGAGHVVLMSRRGSTPEAETAKAALDPSGQRVTLLAGDVSRMADVERVVTEIDGRLPALRGVFHAAGVAEDVALGDQNAAGFARVLAPKVSGGWNLHVATADRGLDVRPVRVDLGSVRDDVADPGQLRGRELVPRRVDDVSADRRPGRDDR